MAAIFPLLSCFFLIKQVSWIRHRDLHLLTVGKETYTPDGRFQSVHNPHTDDWALKVWAIRRLTWGGQKANRAAICGAFTLARQLLAEKWFWSLEISLSTLMLRAIFLSPPTSKSLNVSSKCIRKAFRLLLVSISPHVACLNLVYHNS